MALNKPLNPKVAMTGEISLTGKVLPVGGIKEKTLAAKRSGARIIILPAANKRDFDELPDYVSRTISLRKFFIIAYYFYLIVGKRRLSRSFCQGIF